VRVLELEPPGLERLARGVVEHLDAQRGGPAQGDRMDRCPGREPVDAQRKEARVVELERVRPGREAGEQKTRRSLWSRIRRDRSAVWSDQGELFVPDTHEGQASRGDRRAD
jgi:hypothetical protein